MKTFQLFFFEMLAGCMMVTSASSCSTVMVNNAETEDEFLIPVPQTKSITFGMQASVEAMSQTRATDSSTPTLLLVLDAGPDGSVKTYTRGVSGNDIAGNPLDNLMLNLSYGTHKLYFMAADAKYYNLDEEELTVSWNSNLADLKNCWAESITLTVGQETRSTQSVILPIRVAKIQVTLNDVLPQDVATMSMTLTKGSWQLDLKTMSAGTVSTISRKIAIPANLKGSSDVSVNMYTFVAEDTNEAGTLTVTAQNQSNAEITHHVMENVPVATAQITKYIGNFFSNEQGMSMSIGSEWTINEITY